MTEDSGNLDSLPEPERWEVLARYLDGDSPAKEAEAVRRWIAADPSRMQVVAMLDRAVRQAEVRGPEVDVEGALRRVKARIDQPEVRELRSGARWPRLAFRAAAALAFLVGGSLLWQAVRSGKSIPSEPLIPRAYSTAPGAIDSVPLPGGGYAILGPRSRLTIDLGYGRQTRDVTLEGEALFEVPHDESRPFTVHAGAALVRDIGTTFTVRSDEEGVKVVVISGSVLLRDTIGAAPRTATLGAGDMARLGRQEPVNVRRGIRTDEQTAWTRKRLVFDDATLAQVKDDLRRWYGIELVLADSGLASRHVRASFAGEPPDQVLKVIGLALGASIERRGDTAVVRLRKGGSGPP